VACTALVLARRYQLPWGLSAILAVAPLVLLEVLLQLFLRRRTGRFERQLVALLQAGRLDQLLPLYRRQLLLRFAAPRHLTLGKLGLIYARQGQHRGAASAYREALHDAPPAQRYALALGLGASLFELGEHHEAEQVYATTVDDEHINVQACSRLARLILKRGGDPEEAERYLRLGVDAARGGVSRCELVELLASQGRIDEAREQLELATTELAAVELTEADAAALQRAREAVERASVDG
jgi:tetratricopeptide (TPR) repeat protein